MGSNDASTRANPPDASTLGVTAFNVGMIDPKAFAKTQYDKVAELATHVKSWLDSEELAVVGLNEIAPSIAEKLVEELERRKLDVGIATSESNSLLWRTPQ